MIRKCAFFFLLSLALSIGDARAQNFTEGAQCSSFATYNSAAGGITQLVAIPSGGKVVTYLCGFSFFTNAATSINLVTGTGTNCAVGLAALTPPVPFLATTAGAGQLIDGSVSFRGLAAPANTAVCLQSSGAVQVEAIIYYGQL